MLMTFRSDASANITMFGSVGLQLVDMMGYGKSTSGAVKAEDIPAVLERLHSGLSQETASTIQPEQDDKDEGDDDAPQEPPISLANRAKPLIDMLNAAIDRDCSVMWESK